MPRNFSLYTGITQITRNLQATINFKKKGIKKEKQKSEGTHLSWNIIGEDDSKSVYKESKTTPKVTTHSAVVTSSSLRQYRSY